MRRLQQTLQQTRAAVNRRARAIVLSHRTREQASSSYLKRRRGVRASSDRSVNSGASRSLDETARRFRGSNDAATSSHDVSMSVEECLFQWSNVTSSMFIALIIIAQIIDVLAVVVCPGPLHATGAPVYLYAFHWHITDMCSRASHQS